MPIFSEEQWKEIYAVRERMRAYIEKGQPYPILEGFEQVSSPPSQPKVVDKIIYHHITETHKSNEREVAAKRIRQQRGDKYQGIKE